MKKINKSHIFSFIIGVIISGGITGVLAYKLAANQVSFTPSDSTWQVSDVDNALDSLFDMATYGNASASDIVSGKTALVNGTQVTGNLTVPSYQTLANTENVSAGSSSTTLNGYYNLSNYKVSCASCPTCPACNSCCSNSITWNLIGHSNTTASLNVTPGRIYLLQYSSTWTIISGATAMTSITDMGQTSQLSGQRSYWQVVKATSSTINLSRSVRYSQLGY